MKTLLIIGLGLMAIYIAYRSYRMATQTDGLPELVRKGAVILDVRTVAEFERGHIDGATNIPLSKLHHGPIPLDTGATIITVCSHGLRSVKAVSVLQERGYHHVYNGGAWSDLQQALQSKEQP
ncbi:MAG: rhodanese-like domain-containing protein [Sphingobacteriales bacterium]|nr:MAG: rhodanese-like domain-containing protein [Sphingobacteriales bacterium]